MKIHCVVLFAALIIGLFAGIHAQPTVSQDEEASAEFKALICALQQEYLQEQRNKQRKPFIVVAASAGALAVVSVMYWLKKSHAHKDNDFLGSRDERNELHLDIPERSISDE
ncbi:MAG: hypothetical protein WC365_01610 [Candidatus Babeliales bacterium]|jgi:hypothetical protein